jgi:hypothetical protein
MVVWNWGRSAAVRIVVTATGIDGTVTRWYPEIRQGHEAQTIALPTYIRSVTIERHRRVRVHLGHLRAARKAR